MTSTKEYLAGEKKYRKEAEAALEAMIEDTIRGSAVPNAIAMAGVILGGFLLNVAVMMILIGW
jgi:hypothetical protein